MGAKLDEVKVRPHDHRCGRRLLRRRIAPHRRLPCRLLPAGQAVRTRRRRTSVQPRGAGAGAWIEAGDAGRRATCDTTSESIRVISSAVVRPRCADRPAKRVIRARCSRPEADSRLGRAAGGGGALRFEDASTPARRDAVRLAPAVAERCRSGWHPKGSSQGETRSAFPERPVPGTPGTPHTRDPGVPLHVVHLVDTPPAAPPFLSELQWVDFR